MSQYNIGVIAPSFKPEARYIKGALDLLRAHNFNAVLGNEILSSPPRFTSPFERWEERTEEFISMLARDDIDVLWPVDGGAGACYLLPSVYDWLTENKDKISPKVLFGCSDINFLQMAFVKCGLQAWLSPCLNIEEEDNEFSLNQCILFVKEIIEASKQGKFAPGCLYDEGVDTLSSFSEAEGKILGGTFSCLTHIVNTKYSPSFSGSILVMEDHTPETPGQYEYLFWEKTQGIELSGVWDETAAIVMGDVEVEGPYADEGEVFPSYWEVIRETLGHICQGPLITGVSFGLNHMEKPIPLGANAKLTAKDMNLDIEW